MASRDLNLLTQDTRNKYIMFREKMTNAGMDFVVICTYRSQDEQQGLWNIGRTEPGNKVTWTLHSKHTTGQAFDIEILVGGKGTWQVDPYYKQAAIIAQSVGLTWGGDWGDSDHFQSVPKDA